MYIFSLSHVVGVVGSRVQEDRVATRLHLACCERQIVCRASNSDMLRC